MNTLLQWFWSPEWAQVVKALLHTLWQATLAAGLLGLALRRRTDASARYRFTFAALVGVFATGLVTWALLSRPEVARSTGVVFTQAAGKPVSALYAEPAAAMVPITGGETKPMATHWTAWLALLWLAGAAAMLARASMQVAGAERLRRATRPIEDSHVSQLLADAQSALQLTRKIRVAVTDQLTSPAVVGVLVPTLILPLSLLTTLTPDQLHFVLLHELAHIRRGDYFANLFQLFIESLLFFNPGVWWISLQMRREREACCDALAIELSGAPIEYARTLVHVAENILSPLPTAALGFGDEREPSSLADRIQRLLVPGYRPSLRLTWRAMLVALFVGGALLVASAVGTRLTVHAILSPQQRIAKIEKKMLEYGENPAIKESEASAERLSVTAHLRTVDGSPLPHQHNVIIHSIIPRHFSSYGAYVAKDGTVTNKVPAGEIWVEVDVKDYAPVLAGPFNGLTTNRLDIGEIVLDHGFDARLQAIDAISGRPITNGVLQAGFITREGRYLRRSFQLKLDDTGRVTLAHCINYPLTVTVNAPGYEIVQTRFDQVSPEKTLVLKLKAGAPAAGSVVDKASGKGIAGATVRVLYEEREERARYQWTDPLHLLAQTDAQGRFTANQLRVGTKYWLGIGAPGHESKIVGPINPGAKDIVIKLGPELIVRGRVIGSLDQLQPIENGRALYYSYSEVIGNESNGDGEFVPVRVTNGVATFQFTNRIAGPVKLTGYSYHEEREVTAPIDDWVVDLTTAPKVVAKVSAKREVIFRFKHPSGVSPHGTVSVMIPDNLEKNHLTAHNQEMEITNSEVRAEIPIDGRTSIEPNRMVGYWFNRAGVNGHLLSIEVTNGVGPMVIEIPLIAAGAIYAKARNADGTPAGGLFFGVTELKRAPGRDDSVSLESGGDGISGDGPRKWVSGPLPLGGTYQIHGWRGNSFCESKPIKLTEASPDAEVELQFPAGQSFTGIVLDADEKPLRNAELRLSFMFPKQSFGLNSVFTDESGRFQFANATPEIGTYSIQPNAPGTMSELVNLKFSSQPQTIRLQRGRTLAGRVLESPTGYPIPHAELRALDYDSNKLPMLTTHTDAEGRFEFTTLGDVNYTLYLEGGQVVNDKEFRPNNTNVNLMVKLYDWSKVKPKAPTPK